MKEADKDEDNFIDFEEFKQVQFRQISVCSTVYIIVSRASPS